jgi:hypothetical protein
VIVDVIVDVVVNVVGDVNGDVSPAVNDEAIKPNERRPTWASRGARSLRAGCFVQDA